MAKKEKKERPDISKQQIKEVMGFCTIYKEIQMRTKYYPLRRPSFMARLRVDTSHWKIDGCIDYDREHVEKLHKDDQRFIKQYEYDMRILYFLKFGFESISDPRTREIGEKTLLGGVKCKELSKQLNCCLASVYWERDNARRIVAKFIEESRRKYGYEQDCSVF